MTYCPDRANTTKKLKYAVVIEHGPTCIGAYAPDLPGCGASATSLADAMVLIGESMAFHIDGLLEYGDDAPPPKSTTDEALAYHVATLVELGEAPSEMDTATEVHVSQADPDTNVPVWRIGDGPFNNEDLIHQQFRHAEKPGALTMSGDPDLDIPPGTFNNIIRQAGLDRESFGA